MFLACNWIGDEFQFSQFIPMARSTAFTVQWKLVFRVKNSPRFTKTRKLFSLQMILTLNDRNNQWHKKLKFQSVINLWHAIKEVFPEKNNWMNFLNVISMLKIPR